MYFKRGERLHVILLQSNLHRKIAKSNIPLENRVTRLLRIFAFWVIFILASVWKIRKVEQIFGASFYVLIFTKKLAWATFRVTFSQTHLVTLLEKDVNNISKKNCSHQMQHFFCLLRKRARVKIGFVCSNERQSPSAGHGPHSSAGFESRLPTFERRNRYFSKGALR
jgi:hypothetical protein